MRVKGSKVEFSGGQEDDRADGRQPPVSPCLALCGLEHAVSPLPSIASATPSWALFGDFPGTMVLSDFPGPCIIGMCPQTSRFGLRHLLDPGAQGASRLPCEVLGDVHRVLDRAGSDQVSR
jgi:hypothetical protein